MTSGYHDWRSWIPSTRMIEPRGCPPLNTSSQIFVGVVAYDDGTKESFARLNVTVPVL
jgi:hypothetical protein